MSKKEKQEVEEDIVTEVRKQFGDESIRLGLDTGDVKDVAAIKTGSISLDYALGIGGVPYGRLVEIFGPEASGKTTLALSIVAECQKTGRLASYIDIEHALDPEWCRKIGVNTKHLLFSQPDCAEDAFKVMKLLISMKKLGVVVIDSVAALATKAELEGEPGHVVMAGVARLMSQECKKITTLAAKSGTCVVFINQIRDSIGGPIPGMTTTTGGRALRFYASQRLEIKRIAPTKSGTDIIGSHVQVKVVKNKVAPPFKKAEFDIIYTGGISKGMELIDLGLKHNILSRNGSWIIYGTEKIGLGTLKASEFLTQNHEVMSKVETGIKEAMLLESKEPIKITEEDVALE